MDSQRARAARRARGLASLMTLASVVSALPVVAEVVTVSATTMCLVAPRTAHAGLALKGLDIVYVTPMAGFEMVYFESVRLDRTSGLHTASSPTEVGLAYGGGAGIRLGPISLGALYQRTQFYDSAVAGFNMNKLYGEIGLNFRFGFVMTVLTAGGGWAFYGSDQTARVDGIGGRVGLAVDFYIKDWLSIGPGLSLDAQGYSTSEGLKGMYGGALVGRIGFHL